MAVVFNVNSAVHAYLILAYTDSDKVTLNVGFYYMASAGRRLIGAISLALPAEMAPRPIAPGEGAE